MSAPLESPDSGGAFPRFGGRRCARVAALAAVLVVALAAPAGATWSIVGVDPETDEVGVAIASCVPGILLGPLDEPLEPVVLVPGVGAGVSQAALNSDAPPELQRRIAAGHGADAILAAVSALGFDSRREERQHAVVLLDGTSAGFTGVANQAVALDQAGAFVHAQGNILVSDAVISRSVAAFEAADGDLTSRLVRALQAGAEVGGDSRCGDQTALFAQVAVAGPDDDADAPHVLLSVSVVDGDGRNPVELLTAAHAAGERRWVSGPTFLEEFGPALAVAAVAAVGLVGVVVGLRRRRAS